MIGPTNSQQQRNQQQQQQHQQHQQAQPQQHHNYQEPRTTKKKNNQISSSNDTDHPPNRPSTQQTRSTTKQRNVPLGIALPLAISLLISLLVMVIFHSTYLSFVVVHTTSTTSTNATLSFEFSVPETYSSSSSSSLPPPPPKWLLEVMNRVVKDYTTTTTTATATAASASSSRRRHKNNTTTNTTTSTLASSSSTSSSKSLWTQQRPRPWHSPPKPTGTTTRTKTTTTATTTTTTTTDQEEKDTTDDSDNDNDIDIDTGHCALLFFGLPRSFRTLVLPSIIRYILLPNARHNCDVYVHYYQVNQELPGGRYNDGGRIQSQDVYQLEYATRAVEEWYLQEQQEQQQRSPLDTTTTTTTTTNSTRVEQQYRRHRPVVRFTHDTDPEFWTQRRGQIQRYLTATVPLYASTTTTTTTIKQQQVKPKRKRPIKGTNHHEQRRRLQLQQEQEEIPLPPPPPLGKTKKAKKNKKKQPKQKPKQWPKMPVYFPWREHTWTNVSLINVVKQWHSIDKVFTLMEKEHKKKDHQDHHPHHHHYYSRVGMFRLDCVYLTPIDIALLGHNSNNNSNNHSDNDEDEDEDDNMTRLVDVGNQHAIVPAFSRFPVNDRMIYGPYRAVRIWATQRFRLLEEERAVQPWLDHGYVLHSERFCNSTLFPAMERDAAIAAVAAATAAAAATASLSSNLHSRTSHTTPTLSSVSSPSSSPSLIRLNYDICFVRARADTYVVATDCTKDAWTEGETRDWTTQKGVEVLEEVVVGRKCSYYIEVKGESETTVLAGCRTDQDWYLTQNASGKIILLEKEQVNVIPDKVWMGGSGSGSYRWSFNSSNNDTKPTDQKHSKDEPFG